MSRREIEIAERIDELIVDRQYNDVYILSLRSEIEDLEAENLEINLEIEGLEEESKEV